MKKYSKGKGRKIQKSIILNFNTMDEAQKAKLEATCSCGSNKKYGECHGQDEPCYCGTNNPPKAAKDCCMVSPETHA